MLNNQQKSESNNAFFSAVRSGDTKTIDLLVYYGQEPEKRIDINVQDNEKMTGLHHAAKEGELHTVSYLITLGADTNIKDQYGKIPLDYAIERNNKAIADHLWRNGTNEENRKLRKQKMKNLTNGNKQQKDYRVEDMNNNKDIGSEPKELNLNPGGAFKKPNPESKQCLIM